MKDLADEYQELLINTANEGIRNQLDPRGKVKTTGNLRFNSFDNIMKYIKRDNQKKFSLLTVSCTFFIGDSVLKTRYLLSHLQKTF